MLDILLPTVLKCYWISNCKHLVHVSLSTSACLSVCVHDVLKNLMKRNEQTVVIMLSVMRSLWDCLMNFEKGNHC